MIKRPRVYLLTRFLTSNYLSHGILIDTGYFDIGDELKLSVSILKIKMNFMKNTGATVSY